jgi:hypothetical protein
MPHVEHTVTVNRPARVVFDYLADGMNNRAWRNGVLVIERTNSADGLGATYRQVTSTGPGGRPLDEDYRVTVFGSGALYGERSRSVVSVSSAGPSSVAGRSSPVRT